MNVEKRERGRDEIVKRGRWREEREKRERENDENGNKAILMNEI